MAAGAFQADAEEELAEHGDELIGTSAVSEYGDGAVAETASRGIF